MILIVSLLPLLIIMYFHQFVGLNTQLALGCQDKDLHFVFLWSGPDLQVIGWFDLILSFGIVLHTIKNDL